ncbi:hypothetical protein [Streptococcus pacificus]|uniref:Uncharacterized protein n=1 Tax=Streptococcus pacificus TaxID=2740577 RepID=A0ABS0ZJ72_9STRE|nr:hypothetical protein [Streptococcus pacificus]MBJ8326060.1 hypothetical protein [Streptococcus pacificus]
MEKYNVIDLYKLELINGGSNPRSIFHPEVVWSKIEGWLSQNYRHGGSVPVCFNYTPAYPGKILPQC